MSLFDMQLFCYNLLVTFARIFKSFFFPFWESISISVLCTNMFPLIKYETVKHFQVRITNFSFREIDFCVGQFCVLYCSVELSQRSFILHDQCLPRPSELLFSGLKCRLTLLDTFSPRGTKHVELFLWIKCDKTSLSGNVITFFFCKSFFVLYSFKTH